MFSIMYVCMCICGCFAHRYVNVFSLQKLWHLVNPGFMAEYIVASVVVWQCFVQRLVYCAVTAFLSDRQCNTSAHTASIDFGLWNAYIAVMSACKLFSITKGPVFYFLGQDTDDCTMTTKIYVSDWLVGVFLKLYNTSDILNNIATIFLLCATSPFNYYWWKLVNWAINKLPKKKQKWKKVAKHKNTIICFLMLYIIPQWCLIIAHYTVSHASIYSSLYQRIANLFIKAIIVARVIQKKLIRTK